MLANRRGRALKRQGFCWPLRMSPAAKGAIPLRGQGSDIALVRCAPAGALKKRADTRICPYRGLPVGKRIRIACQKAHWYKGTYQAKGSFHAVARHSRVRGNPDWAPNRNPG